MLGFIIGPIKVKTDNPTGRPEFSFTFDWDKSAVEVISYDLPLRTQQSATGKVVIAGSLNASVTYSMIVIPDISPDYYWMVTTAESTTPTTTTLTVVDYISAYDGVVCNRGTKTGFSNDAATVCTMGNIDDMFRRAPKMQTLPHESGGTEYAEFFAELLSGVTVPIDEYAVENSHNAYTDAGKVLRLLMENGVNLAPKFYGNNPGLYVSAETPKPVEPVYFDDGHAELISASFDYDVCSHVRFEFTDGNLSNFWGMYLRTDNTTTWEQRMMPPPDNQKIGYTKTVYINKTTEKGLSDAVQAAQDIFAKNTETHKVEFWSDKEYEYGQTVTLMLNRGAVESRINSISVNSTDNRKKYVCGELPVTLSEKVDATEWKRVVRLPENPQKGTLVIVG